MAPTPLPEQADLIKRLDYDPETGDLRWKAQAPSNFVATGKCYSPERTANAWNAKMAGKPALAASKRNGYLAGQIGGRGYLQHRVIWKLVHGTEPEQIDHINGDRTDNRLANLRAASNSLNLCNRKLSSNNTSGVNGVYWSRQKSRWAAEVVVDGVKRHLGFFDRIEDAAAARKAGEAAGKFTAEHGSPERIAYPR